MFPSDSGTAVAFQGVTKRFNAVVANHDVSFRVPEGTIHGIAGENGAGKSTIMKILYGMHEPTEGTIWVRGKEARIRTPQDAIRLGIGMVHQHFMLVPTLSVWRNIVLGREGKRFSLNEAKAKRELSQLQSRYGFTLDLDATVEDLPVGHRQQVEILKLLHQDASILILDEPTAVLTPQEVVWLFGRLKELVQAGKTLLIITHKLRELLSFTENVTVMRQGRVVGTAPTSQLDESSLAEMIVGRKPVALPPRGKGTGSQIPVLEIQDLRVLNDNRKPALDGIFLSVKEGEILGIAGVEGNGQRELVECVCKVRRRFSGQISILGHPPSHSPLYETRQKGLAVIPPDRQSEALILDFAVWENFLLGHHREECYRRGVTLSAEKSIPIVKKALGEFDVRPPDPKARTRALSGGNQQKLIIAREISSGPRLVVAAHPTRGVDIGAIEFIHKRLLRLRDEGAGILLVSSELDEIRALSDRILVLYEGKIQGETMRELASETDLGLWMTGGKR